MASTRRRSGRHCRRHRSRSLGGPTSPAQSQSPRIGGPVGNPGSRFRRLAGEAASCLKRRIRWRIERADLPCWGRLGSLGRHPHSATEHADARASGPVAAPSNVRPSPGWGLHPAKPALKRPPDVDYACGSLFHVGHVTAYSSLWRARGLGPVIRGSSFRGVAALAFGGAAPWRDHLARSSGPAVRYAGMPSGSSSSRKIATILSVMALLKPNPSVSLRMTSVPSNRNGAVTHWALSPSAAGSSCPSGVTQRGSATRRSARPSRPERRHPSAPVCSAGPETAALPRDAASGPPGWPVQETRVHHCIRVSRFGRSGVGYRCAVRVHEAGVVDELDQPHDQDRGHESGEQHLGSGRFREGEGHQSQD